MGDPNHNHDRALRKLWQQGQSPAIPESIRDALGADRDLAVERALDSLTTHARAADLVRAAAGLRGEAEQLARGVKQLRVPQRARPPAHTHWRWAAAAAVVAMLFWGGLPQDPGQRVPNAFEGLATQPGETPSASGLGAMDPGDRIVSGSFESAERPVGKQPAIFGAGFDS